ncbi:hypothetical protein BV25DRAFT_1818536 [Artomyces pyxidatus]|uniref:Uncharacterized protein n=1 Tax=Artomyces pyxidatus TaxID=48021 RepID=A0ACB8TIE5_9AGAM|nr:hypothetical protein BV25DRAFT_1818536 [Artomyces pyxidatus]
MIPAVNSSSSQHSARPWWSRSSSAKSSNNEKQAGNPSTKVSGSKKLNNIATAIGLKPKRPALAIQEPPSPVLPLQFDVEHPRTYTNRPPARSVSTMRSWDDSQEPRTPQSDGIPGTPGRHLSYQQSVLTTSEMDPFAAQYATRNIHDPSRLSVFSDVSTSDSHMRKNDPAMNHNRASFASSSEQSHHPIDMTAESPVTSPLLLPEALNSRRASRLTVESEKIVRREPSFFPTPPSPARTKSSGNDRARIPSSPSSTTLTDKSKPIDTAVPAPIRPKTRPRGLTDSGPALRRGLSLASDTHSPSAYPSNVLTTDAGPRVIVRQPSLNRLQPLLPPFAPPNTVLPPTPPTLRTPRGSTTTPISSSMSTHLREPSPSSAASSSSSLSFASSVSSNRDAVANHDYVHPEKRRKEPKRTPSAKSQGKDRGREKNPGRSPAPSISSRSEFSPTRTLKKALSTQSLPRRASGQNSSSMASTSSSPAEDAKAVKKQRSFHHSRIPLPPLPASLRHTNSAGSVTTNGRSAREDPLPVAEQRRGSTQSSVQSPGVVRKRLFSGASLRRSTSSQAQSPLDEDGRSLFSLPDDAHLTVVTTPFSPLDSSSSFWEDPEPGSPGGVGLAPHDYTPQHIMSPADMLKLEALVQDGQSTIGFVRSRGESFTSVSTSMSNAFSDTMSSEMSMPPPLPPPSSMRFPDRFDGTASSRYTAGRLSQQPSPRSESLLARALNSAPASSGRPSTAQPTLSSPPADRLSFPQSAGLSPGLPLPPRSRTRPATATGASRRTSLVPVIPLAPPPAARRNLSLRRETEPIVPRRSIMRKPSFLDIEDEAEKEKLIEPPVDDSFLDMSKSSFDTVRSSTEDFM